MQDQINPSAMAALPLPPPIHPTASNDQVASDQMARLPAARGDHATAMQSQPASDASAPSLAIAPAPAPSVPDQIISDATASFVSTSLTSSGTVQAQATIGGMGPPPVPRTAESHENGPRPTKRLRNESSPTNDRAEFAPIPVSATQASPAHLRSATTTKTNNIGGGNKSSRPYIVRPQFNVPIRKRDGLVMGDIITARKPEPLANMSLVRTKHPDVISTGHGYLLNKERHWLVLGNHGKDLQVHRITTFSGTDPVKLRQEKVKDDFLGPRYKLADYVQLLADHRRHGTYSTEQLCIDQGNTKLHWNGPGSPPSKKSSFVLLTTTETIAIGVTGVSLVGSCTTESLERLLELKELLAKYSLTATTQISKRMREYPEEYSARSNDNYPPTPSFGFQLPSVPHSNPEPRPTIAPVPRLSTAQRLLSSSSVPADVLNKAEGFWSRLSAGTCPPADPEAPSTGLSTWMGTLGQLPAVSAVPAVQQEQSTAVAQSNVTINVQNMQGHITGSHGHNAGRHQPQGPPRHYGDSYRPYHDRRRRRYY